MKITYFLSLVLVLFLPSDVYLQKQTTTEYSSITVRDGQKEIIDLTSIVKDKCTETLERPAGNNLVTIKFQKEFSKEAEKLIDTLETVINETQKILSPLKIDDLKLYILQMDDVPVNYRLNEVLQGRGFYLHFAVFKDSSDLDINDCLKNRDFCEEVLRTIPHEQTHTALTDYITKKKTRWFEEGLANYVGNVVLEKFSVNLYENKIERLLPPVSLHRDDVRRNIFSWKEPDNFKIDRRDLSNVIARYTATQEIITQIVQVSERKGIENPILTLLIKLKELKDKSGDKSGTKDIINLIRQNLKVEISGMGILDIKSQSDFIDEALSTLSQVEISEKTKEFALFILAGIEGVELSDKWVNYLLEQVFEQKTRNEYQRENAATALVVRFKQKGFDELLTTYLENNPQLKQNSPKKVKAELAKLSLRPRPD